MFGVLTVAVQDALPAGQRAALRLRPAKGLSCTEDLFRTAMFCHVRVTLCAGWSEKLQQKRVREALLQLRAKGCRQVVLPREWREAAKAAELVLETDYKMKTSFDEPERLLELLILQLAQEAVHG